MQKRPKVNKQPSIIPISKDHESNELGCHANPIIESSHQSISNSNDQSLVASKLDKQMQDYRSKQGIEYAYLLSRDMPCQLKEYINNHQTKRFPPESRARQHHTSKHHARQTNPSKIRSKLPPGRYFTQIF